MDNGATSHMTHSQGTFINYSPLEHHFNNAIIIGNGHMIPVLGHGHVSLPSLNHKLTLKNVLHALNLSKTSSMFATLRMIIWFLMSLFPFGFSVKDLDTGSIILRSNSTGDLYPFKSTHGATSTPSSAFSALSSSICHSRLGHPGKGVLYSLFSSSLIKCNKNPSFICHSCPLGKHVRLSFTNSISVSSRSFEIIHSDLWTSPVSSPSGYKYYVLFLDNYTNFL